MAATQVASEQIKDGGVARADLNVATPGKAVLTKALAGKGLAATGTGADTGTGDVTFSADSAPTWSASFTYVYGDIVKGSDSNFYRASPGGLNNNPTTDNSTNWELAYVLSSLILSVASRFPTLFLAWNFIKAAIIPAGRTVTIQFANGTYTSANLNNNAPLNLNHPYGSQISILGDVSGTIGNVTLDMSANTYTVPAGYASELHGFFYISQGNQSPLINGFKIIGPGNAQKGYGFLAWNSAVLNFGPKMWVTNFYAAVAAFWSSAVFMDYMRIANGGDGNIFAYGCCGISFQGGLSEGAATYFARAGACIEFGSFLFAPAATFQNNAGAQIAYDFGSSIMVDSSTFTSGGAFDSAPAFVCLGGAGFVQANGCTFNNCSSDIIGLTTLTFGLGVWQLAFGKQSSSYSNFSTFPFVSDQTNTGISITKAGVNTAYIGMNAAELIFAQDIGTSYTWKIGSSPAFGGTTLAVLASVTGLVLSVPFTPQILPKTSTYTAKPGETIAASTLGGSWTLTLPASPTAGMIVTAYDPDFSWGTNTLTISGNGAKIHGSTFNFLANCAGVTLICEYKDTTSGWAITV